jgi:predicted amidohydrolase
MPTRSRHGDALAPIVDAYAAADAIALVAAPVADDEAREYIAMLRVDATGASFAGPTGGGFGRTAGRSGIWSPDGTVLARAGAAAREIARATIEDPVISRGRAPRG